MEEEPHSLAAKWIIKTRLSIIQSMVDGRPVVATVDALMRLLMELEAYTGKRLIEPKE